jgi:assimilatory nitrate reductase catalytic subunit
MQCGMHVGGHAGSFSVDGDARFPVNKGGLCIKGWNAAETLAHRDRLVHPLVRDESGDLVPATWAAALDRVAAGIERVQARYGRDAVGVFGSGSLSNEKAYLLGKFARVALGTANIDYNGRFCMSSAAAAATLAFGLDRGLPFPIDDIPQANVVMLAGSNVAETMPPLMQYFSALRANGGRLIVVDPRRSPTAQWGTPHPRVKPGSDAALANGILHILIRDHLIDAAYIATRTEGFDEVRQLAATYWPERVERLTGIPEADLVETARMMGTADRLIVLTGRGPEQQSQGVNNALAYINIALALGQVGKRCGGYGTITGQGNGQGGESTARRPINCRAIARSTTRPHAVTSLTSGAFPKSRSRAGDSPPSSCSIRSARRAECARSSWSARTCWYRRLMLYGFGRVSSFSTCSSSPTFSCPRPPRSRMLCCRARNGGRGRDDDESRRASGAPAAIGHGP